ncbi:type VI secretion system Vgr family protein [Pseudomonas sp. R11(2017)]|uniref:type VI secretion system Vgr family protein n=2 Tax=unclassified Pseudomonas TaxID=196821 RepID=UPI000A1F4D6E|nr:type VI secretion system tip protein TssI/VgrG [Pseudomonas sp. R11(2017)]
MIMDLAARLTPQHRRLFQFHHPAELDQPLLLQSFKGQDGLSRPFAYELLLLSDTPQMPLKSMIGQQVSIEIELADAAPRFINGYLTHFASLGSDGALDRYGATLSPWLAMLRHRTDTRIFQNCTVDEVLAQVFALYPAYAAYTWRLSQPLRRHTYITQYRESDLNFVQRLLDEAGLFYFFEHSLEGHTLVIGDDSTVLDPLPEQAQIRFHSASVTETADSITQWCGHRQLQAGSMAAQTFDYRQPRNRLPVAMRSINQQGEVQRFEVYDPGQYTHSTSDEGEAWMRLRIEALELTGKRFEGASNCRAMRPGYSFELLQHPGHERGPLGERDFLLMEVNCEGHNNYLTGQQAGYVNTFTCVRKKIPYRPPQSTPRPTISGPQTAIVVGPPGEEIFTDELGRVKVQFHWDRHGEFNEQSSCWVRVAQAGASGGFGSIQIPRVGDEVVVLFLDGNPDRPLIIGSLYNSRNTPPWDLPANKTQSGLLTRSIKGDGGTANFFRFEDKAGAEQVILHAERNLDTEVERDETHFVGNDRKVTVTGTHREIIGNDTLINIQDGSYTLQVDNQFIQVTAQRHITLQVGTSSLTLKPNTILIQADNIEVRGKHTFVKGDRVDINE